MLATARPSCYSVYGCLLCGAAVVASQRAGTVGDEGAGGAHHRAVTDADHRAQAAA